MLYYKFYNWSKHRRSILVILLLCIVSSLLRAQSCSCTVLQVQANTVSPCELIQGVVLNVNSSTAFRNAINQANANGGNMTILIADGSYEIASPISYPYITASNLIIRSASGNRDKVIIHVGGLKEVAPTTKDA